MPSPLALVRPPSASFGRAISTHPGRLTIHPGNALNQHRDYCAALEQAGAEVRTLEPLEAFPDSPFIEDNAVILEGTAFLCNTRAPSRQGEPDRLQPVLQELLPVEVLPSDAVIDGGDVLVTDSAIFIGQSGRTNQQAVDFFRHRLRMPVIPVTVHDALHLKTAVTWLGDNRLILNPDALDTTPLNNFDWLELKADEAYAANCLRLGQTVLMPAGFDGVKNRILKTGCEVRTVEMSEFEKADGGITCLSLVIPR